MSTVIEGWNHLRSGKVRDLYTNISGELLIVASDRISAFDYILPTPIPGKGKLLTQLSLFWFEMFTDLVPNHLISFLGKARFAMTSSGESRIFCKAFSFTN